MTKNISLWSSIIFLFILINVGNSENKRCGYESCNIGLPDALNIHFVSHTHDDLGWKKTVEEYYLGKNNSIQPAHVQRIITTVIEGLMENEQRRFILVEMAFFHMWWNDYALNNQSLRHQVKQLVNTGRLQFALGGWSMNDEATTHYQAIIDQHTRGQRFLDEEFGECSRPQVAWQIDPFGHSREQANLFQKMGFDALFIFRMDSQDRAERMKNKSLEFVWYGSDDSDDNSPLFTSVMENYFTPAGYCFDYLQCMGSFMQNPLPDVHVEEMIRYVESKARYFQTNHILIPIGGDFHYQEAVLSFQQIDKLISGINSIGKTSSGSERRINAFYSTPACYAYAVNQQNSIKFPLKPNSDFFPLMESDEIVWSGYFSSRPTLKRYIRLLNSRLQAVQQFAVTTGFGVKREIEEAIDVARRHMGIAQHHDAITGTAKAAVVDNYKWLLWQAHQKCDKVMASLVIYSNFLSKETKDVYFSSCPLLNISHCEFTEQAKNVTMVVYNGNSKHQKTWLRLPMPLDINWDVKIFHNNQEIASEYVPVSALPGRGHLDLIKKFNRSTHEVLFPVFLPPLGYFAISLRFSNTKRTISDFDNSDIQRSFHILRNQFISVSIDKITGLVNGKYKSLNNQKVEFSQTFCVYTSDASKQGSGAYNFRPKNKDPECFSKTMSYKIFRTDRVQEVHQIFSDKLSQVVRIYEDSKFVEFEWTVGPLDSGMEVTLHYVTPWRNEGEFFTDANCRQRLLRRRDKRDFMPFRQYSPIAGNYYPIDCFISLPSTSTATPGWMYEKMLSILTDRAQGGGSIRDGQVEIMVHRKSLSDDDLGIEEPLLEVDGNNEGFVARGKHYVLLANAINSDTLIRKKAQKIFHEPFQFFLYSKKQTSSPLIRFPSYLGLAQQLPDQIHISSLDQWKNNTKLLRLEHIYSKDNNIMGVPVKVNVGHLFRTFKILKMKELLLTGLEPNVNRLVWNSIKRQEIPDKVVNNVEWTPGDSIEMKPMQIRTFQITIRYSYSFPSFIFV